MKYQMFLFVVSLIVSVSCSGDSAAIQLVNEVPTETSIGSGYFEYSGYAPFGKKQMRIYYYIPKSVAVDTQIVFGFHGNGRDARNLRNELIAKADQHSFVVIVPEFSYENFPGGDAYNLGNVFVDGDNPSLSTLNPETEWSFSVVEPLFDFITQRMSNATSKYHIIGHSAGGQFAHRFLLFKPNARYDKVVASAPGWYTCPDLSVPFPYGFERSPLENLALESLFQKNLLIQVGSMDTNTGGSLRHNSFADAQGLTRLDRAQYFFNKASEMAAASNLDFKWELYIIEGANHDFTEVSQHAADLIFN